MPRVPALYYLPPSNTAYPRDLQIPYSLFPIHSPSLGEDGCSGVGQTSQAERDSNSPTRSRSPTAGRSRSPNAARWIGTGQQRVGRRRDVRRKVLSHPRLGHADRTGHTGPTQPAVPVRVFAA